MPDLRSATIRLAHTTPSMREHLLPLLKVATPAYFTFAKEVRAFIKEMADGPVSARVFEVPSPEKPTSVVVSFNIVGTKTRFTLMSDAEAGIEDEIESLAARHGMRLLKKGNMSKWQSWMFEFHGVTVEVNTNGVSAISVDNGDGTSRLEKGTPVR